eukprot:TRINITY_DN570_c0_g1_i1.p1 TRINITY_DN570_c0_g1~~TRINITY_DN570_c0_g1_i1.p1  ORF type:complete len:283 (-),score=81.09 TRINITY_DN570_c0_g1_i1:826-1674(-)
MRVLLQVLARQRSSAARRCYASAAALCSTRRMLTVAEPPKHAVSLEKEGAESVKVVIEEPTVAKEKEEEDKAQQEDGQDLKTRLLDAAVGYVSETGWTDDALRRAASDMNLSPAVIGMFPRGTGDLVTYYMQKNNKLAIQKLAELPLEDMRPSGIIRRGLQIRFELQAPLVSTWSEAIVIGALPQNATYTAESILKFVDDLWVAAGDESAGDAINWYSKRAALVPVYAAVELYMLTDKSPDFQDTWKFIENRVEDTMKLSTIPAEAERILRSTIGQFLPKLF